MSTFSIHCSQCSNSNWSVRAGGSSKLPGPWCISTYGRITDEIIIRRPLPTTEKRVKESITIPSPIAFEAGVSKPGFLHPHRSFGFLLDIPQSNARHWMALAASAVWGFGVSKPVFLHPHRSFGFLLDIPQSNARHWQLQQYGDLAFSSLCFSIPTVVLAFFLTFHKATLGTGSFSSMGIWRFQACVSPSPP